MVAFDYSKLSMMPTCKVIQCRKRKLNVNGFCVAHEQYEHADASTASITETCKKCNQGFEVTEAAMTCDYCEKWFHNKCSIDVDEAFYNALIDEQDKIINNGIKWFCDDCNNLIATLFQDNKKNKKPQAEITIDVNGSKTENTQKVCNKLKYGTCPHGITGKSESGGKICEFLHPKICKRYTRNGPHGRYGCNGHDCNLLHPMLCAESVKNRKCNKIDCKLYHLRWTERRNKNNRRLPAQTQRKQDRNQTPYYGVRNSVHGAGARGQHGNRSRPLHANNINKPLDGTNVDYSGNTRQMDWQTYSNPIYPSNDFLDPLVTNLRSEMNVRFKQLETLIRKNFQTPPLPKEGYPPLNHQVDSHPRWLY